MKFTKEHVYALYELFDFAWNFGFDTVDTIGPFIGPENLDDFRTFKILDTWETQLVNTRTNTIENVNVTESPIMVSPTLAGGRLIELVGRMLSEYDAIYHITERHSEKDSLTIQLALIINATLELTGE